MEKGTIVYLDGIKCHLGEIDHTVTIDGEEWYVFESVLIEGEYTVNDGTDEESFMYSADCCSVASNKDVQLYNSHRQ